VLLTIAERFRDVLVPFLIAGSIVLAILFAILIVQRLVRAALQRRHLDLLQRYRPVIAAALTSDARSLANLPAPLTTRHRAIAGELVLATLRIVRGPQTARALAVADHLKLTTAWRTDLGARRWWHRAEAALALGLLRDRKSVRELIALLDDDHEQVRAAAIDALGQIGDTLAVPALLARMGDPTRHERARLIQALRAFGDRATPALVEHGERHPADRALVATVLSHVGGAAAAAALLEWSKTEDPATRAAVWTALSTIGLDDRAFYHAIKALDAAEPPVRAAAARALARCGRDDASAHLASRLDDDWEVAAHAARALARLGASGKEALLLRAAGGPGLGQDLALQVLWESGHR
jgi:hypothetical protein